MAAVAGMAAAGMDAAGSIDSPPGWCGGAVGAGHFYVWVRAVGCILSSVAA